jgi:hypothetical protein
MTGRHFLSRPVAGLLAAALALSACTSSGEDSDAVHPFSEVQADEFVFEIDPTSLDRGIFRVTTTEPMICAIVWGPTETLGNFNNSLSMNGTGIVDHDVFLPGAEPGETYFFRVQGSTADGSLYQSELTTFTLPERQEPTDSSPDEQHGPNLALDGTVAEVSSEFNDSFAAANATDDVGTTEWSSSGDGDDAFITIDLGTEREIAGVEFITRSMLDGTAIANTFTVSIDGGEPIGPFPAGTAVDPNFASVDATGRMVRFDVEESTGGNVGAVEVRILAP